MKQLKKKQVRSSQPVRAAQRRDVNIELLKGTLLHDQVLVRPISIERAGSIVKPMSYEDKHEFGEVALVGEGRVFDNGTVMPLRVKKGDIVFFQKYSAQKLRSNGEDYLFIREEDIYWIQ